MCIFDVHERIFADYCDFVHLFLIIAGGLHGRLYRGPYWIGPIRPAAILELPY